VGYLDDLVLVPLGILLVIRLIPPELMAEHRAAAAAAQTPPLSRRAAVIIAGLWIAASALGVWLAWRILAG
jgi:hypothetical protein